MVSSGFFFVSVFRQNSFKRETIVQSELIAQFNQLFLDGFADRDALILAVAP